MAILGSNIPIASFYFRSTVGFPKCCSKDAYPKFGHFDSNNPMPGTVQDLDVTNDLLDVMKKITDLHLKQLNRTFKLFLLVVVLIFGCATMIGLIILSASSTTDHTALDPLIYACVLGFNGCVIAFFVSSCCCMCIVCLTSRDIKKIIGDFNMRCEFHKLFP